ncbi:MAG: DEAD/DEAH box helicase [Acidobacteriota bacterium]
MNRTGALIDMSRSKQRREQKKQSHKRPPVEEHNSGVPAAVPRKSRREELANFLHGIGAPPQTAFVPDQFQLEAIDLVTRQNCDVLVAAPTGSGKTWIATEAIKQVLAAGSRAWYTSPLKALSNDKFREFSALYGADNVGILTGDRKINSAAPLIVATTEIYRNMLYDAMNELQVMNVRLVVFDEVHYLADRERGVVWEEAIIYSPSVIRALMLSATVGNARELADWVAWARGTECRLVSHPDRPVPLRTGFIDTMGKLLPLTIEGQGLHPEIRAIYEAKPSEPEERRRTRAIRRAFKFRRY